jgi:hypothetical protein
MPSLPFREADVSALLDADAHAVMRRLGPDASWDAVGAALAGSSPASLAASPGLWRAVVEEFTDFVCTDSPRYADLRTQWDDLCSRSAAIAITALTAALAAQLGVASTIAGPLVVWLVLSAVRIGTRAFCDVSTRPREQG